MKMISNYFKQDAIYTEKYGEKAILLWQCGHFIEVYGLKNNKDDFLTDKIENFARTCDMTIAPKSTPGRTGKKSQMYQGNKVFMAGFSPVERADKYISRLTENGYIVALWLQDPKVVSIRTEAGVFTPGTNFNIKNREITNNIMCIWIDQTKQTLINKNPVLLCGMASIDIYTGSSNMFQFKEQYFHNPTTFDEIERFYSTHNPTEIIIIHNCSNSHIDEIIQFSAIDCETIHKHNVLDKDGPYYQQIKNCDKQKYQKELLEKFYKINNFDNFFESLQFKEFSMGTMAFCFLLDFIYLMQPDMVKKIKEPVFNNTTSRLILANHSTKQLNIINTTAQVGKISSVVSFLNNCKTPMGKRKLRHMILNPTTDIDYLQKEYKIVDYVKTNFEVLSPIQKKLSQICDFERLFRKMVLKRVTPGELVQFFKNLKVIKEINKIVKKDKTLKKYINKPNLSKCYKKLSTILKNNLKLPQASTICSVSFDENIFKIGVNTELDAIANIYIDSDDKLQAIKKYLNILLKKYEKSSRNRTVSSIKEHKTDKSGLYLELTKRRSEILKRELDTIKTFPVELKYVSSFDNKERILLFDADELKYSSGTGNNKRIDTPILTNLYRNILHEKENLKIKLKDVYSTFIESLQEYKNEIDNLINFIISLDVLLTRAKLAIDYNYCCPTIEVDCDKSFVNAKNMRHILIEHLQTEELYVPNDIKLGIDEEDGILLYGTNAVGKSSLIKSIGISIILAQAGFFVPCDSFTFNPYKSLFTRILGNDNIFKGLSTFAVEMSELNIILKGSNKNSLILGDEVCSGTETISALSIFISTLIKLNNKNSSFIFATHLHELISLKYLTDLERIKIKHMAIECKNGIIIYDRKLREGSGSSIYGLEVCKSLHMPTDFLETAHRIRCEISPKDKNPLSFKSSRYNSKKSKGNCELCGLKGNDIHHMFPQELSDKNGFIKTFHKNHKANLMNICKECHDKVTREKTIHKRVKTSEGMQLVEI